MGAETPAGWRSYRIGDLAEVYDGPHATPKTVDEGPVFLGIQALQSGRLVVGDTRHVTEEDFVTWTRRVEPRGGDLVFSYETRLGEAALIPPDLRCCLGRRMGLLRIRSDAQVVARMLLLAYLGPQFQGELQHHTIHGSTVDRLPIKAFPEFRIVLPPMAEQRAIVSVLGSLDDKIESNQRLGRHLADVVLASVDHASHHSPRRTTLGEVGQQIKLPGDSDKPYVGLDAMPPGSTILESWASRNAPSGASWAFQTGDILFGKLRPYFRKVAVAPIDGRCTREILVIRPAEERYYGLLVGSIASQAFIDFCVSVSKGTRMPRAEWQDASGFEIGLPATEVLEDLERVARVHYEAVAHLIHESGALKALRDALLPKLVSGQIRVPLSDDPEEMVGAAVEAHEEQGAA